MIRLLLVLSAVVPTWGCISAPLPDRPSTPVRSLIQQTHFDAVVAVYAPGYHPRVAEDFARELRETALFREVVLGDLLTGEPDLVATVTDQHFGSGAIIPFFSLITLWVVPTWFDDGYGQAFEFSLPPSAGNQPSEPIRMDSRYEGTSLMGFAAVLINILPNRGFRQPENTPRYTQALAGIVVEHADEIESLLAQARANASEIEEPAQQALPPHTRP